MLKSVKEISAIVGSNRETVQKRCDQLGLIPVDGPKSAKLYDTRALITLVPLPSRGGGASDVDGSTLEEARIRQTLADAEVKELTAKKLRGDLADVSELLASQNDIFDQLAAIVKKSNLADTEKEDILSAMAKAVRFWETGN